jgi:rRNA maturation protein Nop10
MEIPRHWRLKKQRYALVGEVCPHCDAKLFPPRDICPNCGQEARTEYQFSGKGEVFSYSTVYDAPAGYESQVPYTVALVKLEEDPWSQPSSPTWVARRWKLACRWRWSRANYVPMVTSGGLLFMGISSGQSFTNGYFIEYSSTLQSEGAFFMF